MSAHDHPRLSDITNLAVAVAFLQRVLCVHEIASCHGGGLCRARFASGGLVWRREGVACSDACCYQACAFLATAVGALLILRRVTRACSLFSCCVLALHRREAPLRSAGSPAHGPAPHAANNRNAGKWSAFMCSHIPKIGGQAPVTLRYSDHECRRSILNLGLWDCFFPVLRTLTWRSTSTAAREQTCVMWSEQLEKVA